MIPCVTKLCDGEIISLESWKQGLHCDFSAAECISCGCAYWLIKRDNQIFQKHRSLVNFDQRSQDRDMRRRKNDNRKRNVQKVGK